MPAHALLLQLPRDLCIKRAAARRDHEGGVTAKEAPAVVSRMAAMLLKAGPPTRAEGLGSVMVCKSDADVARALQAWSAYRGAAAGGDAGGCGGGCGGASAGGSLRQAGSSGADADMQPWRVFSQRHRSAAAQPAAQAAAGPPGSPVPAGRQGSAAAPGSSPREAERPAKRQALDPGAAQHNRQAADATRSTTATAPGSSLQQPTQPGSPQAAAAPAPTSTSPAKPSQPANAFTLMAAASRKASATPTPTTGRTHSTTTADPSYPDTPLERAARTMRAKLGAPWAQPLAQLAQHPERLLASEPSAHVDAQVALLPDKYPKARHHVLVVARDPGLASVYDLRREHVPLLRHMMQVAQRWVRDTAADPGSQHGAAAAAASSGAGAPGGTDQGAEGAEGAGLQAGPGLTEQDFVMGFHSVPSMRQLHMHVLSRDMDSPALKNKKHWNSFTTGFFLPAQQVLQQLERSGGVEGADLEAAEALLKGDMRCHRCGLVLRSVPLIKKHLAGCTAAGYTSWQE